MKQNFYANIMEAKVKKGPVIGDDYFLQTKEEIEKELEDLGIYRKYTINEDLTIDVNGDIKIIQKISKFKIKFNKIKGNFTFNNNNLISLKGCPEEVGGDFNCGNNSKLTSLEYSPKKVGGGFYCYRCKLTSLKYSPQYVGSDFLCDSNKLVSLDGCPEKINGKFTCIDNKLTSLKGSPTEIMDSFYCDNNEIVTLENMPKKIGGSFYCSGNKLKSLKGMVDKIGEDFSCYDNQLTSLEYCPEKINGNFLCSGNKLTSFEYFPVVAERISIERNPINTLKGLINLSGNLLSWIVGYYPELDWKEIEWDKIKNMDNIVTELYEISKKSDNAKEALRRIEELQLY